MSFERRPLKEWAEDSLKKELEFDFLQYCKNEYGKESTDEISKKIFLALKSNFENRKR
jgi:hypothetical protein